jgi:hypothetical protein
MNVSYMKGYVTQQTDLMIHKPTASYPFVFVYSFSFEVIGSRLRGAMARYSLTLRCHSLRLDAFLLNVITNKPGLCQ